MNGWADELQDKGTDRQINEQMKGWINWVKFFRCLVIWT